MKIFLHIADNINKKYALHRKSGDSKEAFMQNSRNSNARTARERNKAVILKMVLMACLISIVVIFQLMGTFIKIGPSTSVSLVLIPIVIGSVLLGPVAGAVLGAVFGIVVLLSGITALMCSRQRYGKISPWKLLCFVSEKVLLQDFAPDLYTRH